MEKLETKNARSVLKELLNKNVKVTLDLTAENIEVTGDIDSLTDGEKMDIRNHKSDIIEILKTRSKLKDRSFETIDKVPDSDSYPLSNAQRRLWMMSQYKEASVAYNMPLHASLNGNYHIDSFKKAVHAVVERHEILRTIFREDEAGEVRQWVLETSALDFVIDYQDYRETDQSKEAAASYIAGDSYQPFDLELGPLLRASLLQVSDNEYVFYFNMHHIISDGWSLEVMITDVMRFYALYAAGKEIDIPPLRIQYRDYAVWQLNQIGNDSFGSQKSFWINKLNGNLPVLDLPSRKNRPRVKTYNGWILKTYISAETTAALRSFIGVHGGSIFTGLLATLKILVYRYVQEKDLIMGTLLAGRDHIDLEDQIGFYVNTLALRSELNPTENFTEFYARLKENVVESFNHQKYPFDRLVEDLGSHRDTSRSAVFDIIVVLQNIKERTDKINPEDIDTIFDLGESLAKFDFGTTFQEEDDCLSFEVVYNTDVYEKDMVIQLMHHFKQMLDVLLQNQLTPITSVDYLLENEKLQLLNEFNNSDTPFKKGQTLIDLFQKQVDEVPTKLAVVFEDTQLTYAELDALTNQLARCLMDDHQAKKGDLIGVKLDRSELFIVSMLAILKIGAAYVPIDPDYPEARKEFILNDSGVNLLITDSNYIFDLDYYEGNLFTIDIDFDKEAYDAAPLSIEIANTDLAYVIYTSGSTGKPKGVMVEHKGIVNTMLAQIDLFNLKACERSLQFASFSFDASVSEIFITLLSGSCLFIVGNSYRKNPDDLGSFIAEYAIDIATLPPSFLKMMKVESLKNLKVLVTAGEAAIYDKVASYLSFGGTFFNAYGPTEASICGSAFKMTADTSLGSTIVPIGTPIANAQMYILDEDLNLQPKGVVGEICIGGAGLAKGYLNRPELTSEKFVPHPFQEGERIYKTGDMGKWLPDGNIEFIGRHDDQVKIRGHRIELGEVIHQLESKDDLKEATVLVEVSDAGDKELVAYLVSDTEQNVTSLRDYLSGRLPDYMLPSHFIQLDKIPLNTNGKVDQDAIQALKGRVLSTGVVYEAAQSLEEKLLVEVLEGLLKKENISIHDNFYHMGGDSIKSFQMLNKIKQQGYTLNVEDILSHPIIKDLAGCISVNTQIIDQSMVEGPVLLTPIQYYFFNSPTIKNHSYYNQSALLRSPTPVDRSDLEACVKQLVTHHDALRLVFTKTQDGWQQFNKPVSEDMGNVIFYDLSAEDNPLEVMGEIASSIQSGFNLEEGPLFKLGHFRFSDCDYMALIVHHLVMDGVSWRILLEDISSLYAASKEGISIDLPLKSDSYQRWSQVLTDYVQQDQIMEEQAYWEQVCAHDIVSLPTDHPVDSSAIVHDSEIHFSLDKETTHLLKSKVHQVYNTEINDVLLTGLGLALKEVFGMEQSAIKMEGHGREHIVSDIDVSRTVGWFTSVFPVVLDMSASVKPSKHMVAIKENLRKIPNKGIGYWMLKYLRAGTQLEITPTVEFNHLGDFGDSVGGSSAQEDVFEYSNQYIGANGDSGAARDVLLSVLGAEAMGSLTMTISYSKSAYTEDTMDRFIKAYEKQLKTLILEVVEEGKTMTLTQGEDVGSNLNANNERLALIGTKQRASENQKYMTKGLQSAGTLGPYNIIFESVEQLDAQFRKFIDVHPVLAMNFVKEGAEIYQVPLASKDVKFPVEVRHYDDGDDIVEISKTNLTQPFDLFNGELIRLFVGIHKEHKHAFLLVSIHHALTDHHSNTIIGSNFNEFLQNPNFKGNDSTNLDIAKWQSQFLKSAAGQEYRTYWKDLLNTINYATVAEASGYNDDNQIITETMYLRNGNFDTLRQIHLDGNLPMTAVMLAIHRRMIQQIYRRDNGLQLVIVNGREQDDGKFSLEDKLGVVNNYLPLPFSKPQKNELDGFMRRGYGDYLSARSNQLIPYNIIKNDFTEFKDVDIEEHVKGIFNFRYVDSSHFETSFDEQKDNLEASEFDIRDKLEITCLFSENIMMVEFTYPSYLIQSNPTQGLRPVFDATVQELTINTNKKQAKIN